MTQAILLYIGAILIAYEIAGEVSHLTTLVVTLVSHIFEFLINNVDRWVTNFPKIIRIGIRILIRVVLIPIFVVAIALAIVITGLWLVGQVIKFIDIVLNKVYRFEVKRIVEQQPKITKGIIHVFLPKIKDDEISSALEKIRVPLLAFLGIVLLTIGFNLELISRN